MRSSDPLHIAFVWHMHQPYYRQDVTAPFDMPWARMHALKDYLDMVETLSDFPALHHTFNLVPSLVEEVREGDVVLTLFRNILAYHCSRDGNLLLLYFPQ